MKLSRKIVPLIQFILIFCTLPITTKINILASQSIHYNYRKINNVAVLLNKLDNPYINQFKQDLENIQSENKDKVNFTFYDDKNNISLQYETLDLVTRGDFDLIVALLVDTTENSVKDFILKVIYCDWSREVAKNTIENVLLRYDGKIESIIANNDDMAIGAIEGLKKYGYNTDDQSKYIPVFGIGGVTEAKELFDKGFLAGTVIEDSKEFAEGTYIIGMNLINNVNPLENTNFKLENKEINFLKNPKEYTNNINIK